MCSAVQADSMEEFLWSENRNWSVEDINRVPSESVDWLYDRNTHGNQAVAEVQRATLHWPTPQRGAPARRLILEAGALYPALYLALLLLGEAKISAIEVR